MDTLGKTFKNHALTGKEALEELVVLMTNHHVEHGDPGMQVDIGVMHESGRTFKVTLSLRIEEKPVDQLPPRKLQ